MQADAKIKILLQLKCKQKININIIMNIMKEQQQPAHEFYQWITSQPFSSASFMKFKDGEQAWQKYSIASNIQSYKPYEIEKEKGTLQLLTINVLTDCTMEAPLKRNILFSQQRYAYILQYISGVLPHLITFNQATLHFYEQLAACEWARKYYWISQFQHKQGDGSFNVIACRLPPLYLRTIKADNCNRHILTAYFIISNNINNNNNNNNNSNNSNNSKIISVSCAHLTSNIKNIERRVKQIKQLTKQLPTMYVSKNKDNMEIVNVVQGDLNIHAQSENTVFIETGWKDAWIQRYANLIKSQNSNKLTVQNSQKSLKQYTQHCQKVLEGHPGYTFDSQVNSMIKQVFWGLQCRRMRLDRVIYKGSIHCANIEVVLSQPIYSKKDEAYPRMGYVKAAVSLLGDIAGINIFRNKNYYLFPSDHFGLLSSLALTS